jgi:TetR/AcrR family transcriptional regulator, cholesterol catabolism regulator
VHVTVVNSTRSAIDEAALDLFARLGYHATSMRAIAAAAGVQPASLYHWYPSKESILVGMQDAFMDGLTTQLVEAMDEQPSPAHVLGAAVRAHVDYHGRHQRAAFVTDTEIRALEPAAQAKLIERRDAYEQYFEAPIRAGVEAGQLACSAPKVATYAILLQCTGVALWFAPEGPMSLDEVCDVHVELVLGSVGASRPLIAEVVAATR